MCLPACHVINWHQRTVELL